MWELCLTERSLSRFECMLLHFSRFSPICITEYNSRLHLLLKQCPGFLRWFLSTSYSNSVRLSWKRTQTSCRTGSLAPKHSSVFLPLLKPLHYHISSRGKQKGLVLIICMQAAVQHPESMFSFNNPLSSY